MCYEEAGRFLLCYQPGTRPKREFVTVTPKGLRYRKQFFATADRLVDHFKRHWNDVPSAPHASAAMRTSASSTGYGNYRR
jgi:hypothetical protein